MPIEQNINTASNQLSVARYYDYTLPFYNIFWHRNSHALHFGFSEKYDKNSQAALMNVNRCLAKKANITASDTVLDAGCGIGGSAFWLAKNIGCNVIGITVSDRQLAKARQLAEKYGVSAKVQFFKQDFTNTDFKSESFDVVWGIESVCYASDKKDFLKEAYRVLKKGGRLVVADGFISREARDEAERKIIYDICAGWELPNLAKFSDFEAGLRLVGFQDIEAEDKSDAVRPSSKKMYRMCSIAYPISQLTALLRLTPKLLTLNNLAGIRQYEGGISGLFCYGMFYAKK